MGRGPVWLRRSRTRKPVGGARPLTVLVDDQTLAALFCEEIRGLEGEFIITGHWYLRLCQAVGQGTGGNLSGPLLWLPPGQRERALRAVLELPELVPMLSWRVVAPMMANQLHGPGHGLNLLSREALAVTSLLDAEVIMAPGNEKSSEWECDI